MAGVFFLTFAALCGAYLAFMLATGETLQANSKMQRITRKSSPAGFRLYVIIMGVFCAGALLMALLTLIDSKL